MRYVPVVDFDQRPLMPTTANRAASWIKSGKATPFWKRGVFCVRLNVEPSDRKTQPISCGIDPGSKREAFTVKADAKTLINVQTKTVDHVKDAMEVRRYMRRARRFRKTPYRKCRPNRKVRDDDRIPPSTKARWDYKLSIVYWLKKMYPITSYVVENVRAITQKGKRRWNSRFSPAQNGKRYFYRKLLEIGKLKLVSGFRTAKLRARLNLVKIKNKLSREFEAHCVDSWVLSNLIFNDSKVESRDILHIAPLQFHRRQLHVLQFAKGGVRKDYGGTRSLGLKRGSLVEHPKYGVCYVGGSSKGRISLHNHQDGSRLCQNAKVEDVKFLTYLRWRGDSSHA